MVAAQMDRRLILPVKSWCAWMPGRDALADWAMALPPSAGLDAAYPDCRFVDAGQRRRLSPLARICLHLARECAGDLPAVRVVFASRHGEINRTHLMLEDIVAGEPVSPTAFGLSVHNAIVGMLSLLRQDVSATTAIAAGEQTLGYGLLQAGLDCLSDASCPVLLLFADLPLHPFYQDADRDLCQPQGLAVLFAAGGQPWALAQDSAARPGQGWPQLAWFAHALAAGHGEIAINGWRLCAAD